MPHTRRLLQAHVFALICAALFSVSLHAATLSVHKVSAPPALHPLPMSVIGRTYTTPSATPNNFGGRNYIYQWPGTCFRAAFQGPSVFFRIVKGEEILHITIDSQSTAPLVKPTSGVYEIDSLSPGAHTIAIFVATESQAAPDTFGGFAIPSREKVLTPVPRHQQVEFIGDSFTVGYGDLSTTSTCDDAKVWADTDDTLAFGPLTARHYHADYQVNAISGRGVVRNYNGGKADTLPQAYPYVLFDKKQKYTDPAWNPQVIVVSLGTNDFSTALNPGEPWKTREQLHADYEATYAKFLQQLRAKNPSAYILVWATDVAKGEVEAESQKVVQQLQKQGHRNIAYLPVNGLGFTGCNGHPSLADHRTISEDLIHLIDADKPALKQR
jgi:lysophospholipase L1-like esterase